MIHIYVFNTLTIGDKTYKLGDQTRVDPPSEYGLHSGWYGGRIWWVGKTDSDVLLFIEKRNDRYELIDTGSQSLAHIPIDILRKLCDQRSIPYLTKDSDTEKATTHKELQKLLK